VSHPSSSGARALLVVLAAALVLGAGAAKARMADYELWVVFHDNDTITLVNADGTPVASGAAIPAGWYTLHFQNDTLVVGPNFDLRGPGVSLQENMFNGESPVETHRVDFLPGSTYTWRDLEQPGTTFTFSTSAGASASGGSSAGPVSGGSSSSSANTPSSVSQDIVGSRILPFRGTLTGGVSSAGKLSLLFKGKAVASLQEGRYTASVTDESAKAGFILELLGRIGSVASSITVTKLPFVGRQQANLSLRKGQWVYVPSGGGKKTYFVVTA